MQCNRVEASVRELEQALPRLTKAIQRRLDYQTQQLGLNDLVEYGMLIEQSVNTGILKPCEGDYLRQLLGDYRNIERWIGLNLAERVALSKLMDELVQSRCARQN